MRYAIKTVRIQLEVTENDKLPQRKIARAEDAETILRAIYSTLDADQEHFIVLALNIKNQILGYKVVSSGGQDASTVDPKIVFRNALALGAAHLILAHNHPSGDPYPSDADIRCTKALEEGGKILQIFIIDHIVLGAGTSFFSFKMSGHLLQNY